MRIRLVHRTVYRYARPVRLGPQRVRLRPLPSPRRMVGAYGLAVTPTPTAMHWQMDPLGNAVARLVLPGPIDMLTLDVSLELDLAPVNAFDFLLDPDASSWPFRYAVAELDLVAAYRRADHAGPSMEALQAETCVPGETVGFVLGLAAAVRDRVAYIGRDEAGVWPADWTLREARGSCRDSAWLLVQLLRMHGIAARFVSGYLVQTPEDGSARRAELHAWAEAYLPGAGWIGLDSTSGLLTAEGHVALAAAPEPAGAAPLTGTVEPGAVTLETSIALHDLA